MKILKKVVYMITFIMLVLIMSSTIIKATTTITVTADTLNLRKKASTSSDIVTLLSKGDSCELIEEYGEWYKVKYKTYTGYVSKEYVKKKEETNQKSDTKKVNDKKDDQQKDDTQKSDNKHDSNTTQTTVVKITGKTVSKTDVKIMPLIYSSKINELSKNTSLTILTELDGWVYVETNTVTGWIRSNVITGKKEATTTTGATSQGNDVSTDKSSNDKVADDKPDTSTEKTMYVAESAVNVRKEANTSSKIMMELALNTKLTIIGESGEWYKVKTSEGNGYVLKKLLSEKQKSTSRGSNPLEHDDTTNQEQNKVGTVTTGKLTNTVAKVTSPSSTPIKKENTTSNKVVSTSQTTTQTKKSNSTKGQDVVTYAKKFLGVKYVYGGASKSGFDCSGFTMYVYKKFGISMRHGAQAQAKLGKKITVNKKSSKDIKQKMQAGDLVFFLDYETMDEIGHCGIYIGDGKFIHASSGSGYCVKINSLLPGDYYNTRFCGVRRVL